MEGLGRAGGLEILILLKSWVNMFLPLIFFFFFSLGGHLPLVDFF